LLQLGAELGQTLPQLPQFFASHITPMHCPPQIFAAESQHAHVPLAQWALVGQLESTVHAALVALVPPVAVPPLDTVPPTPLDPPVLVVPPTPLDPPVLVVPPTPVTPPPLALVPPDGTPPAVESPPVVD
jgi:hypothetical protein